MAKGKVLVVDDEPEIVKTVSMRLKANDYEVITAGDGVSATNAALSENPDVIILDIGMPAGDGHVVAERLRDTAKSLIPIIFLTAHTSERDYLKAFNEGVAKYITKPFRPEELIAAVDELIDRRS
jgi:DNA-binding response OmpR family regulator